MPKPKPVNWELIEDSTMYDMVEDVLKQYHKGKNSIENVQILLMWKLNIKADQDGYVFIADISKSSDKIRELRDHDMIIAINKYAWTFMDDAQKKAVIDAQLERIAVCVDKDENPKEDDRARPLFRLRKPEVINEATIQRRHNICLNDIQETISKKCRNAGAEDGSYIAEVLNG